MKYYQAWRPGNVLASDKNNHSTVQSAELARFNAVIDKKCSCLFIKSDTWYLTACDRTFSHQYRPGPQTTLKNRMITIACV